METILGAVEMMERLYDPKHTFVIHLDAKANRGENKVLRQALAKFKVENSSAPEHFEIKPHNNLIVLQNHAINWCGFTMIQATFDMISAALQTGRWFDSVVLLSGSCHPVKPPQYIENKLKELRGKLLLKLDGTGGSDDKGEKTIGRYDLYWIDYYYEADKLSLRADEFDSVRKNYPADLQRSAGSQWVTLSREFAEYVITSPWVKKLFIAHSTSFVPDETMFQLIANNSPFINNTFTVPTDDIKVRYERWQKNQAHPVVLNEKDALDIVRSPALFARKLPPKPEVRSFFSRLAQQLWAEDEE